MIHLKGCARLQPHRRGPRRGKVPDGAAEAIDRYDLAAIGKTLETANEGLRYSRANVAIRATPARLRVCGDCALTMQNILSTAVRQDDDAKWTAYQGGTIVIDVPVGMARFAMLRRQIGCDDLTTVPLHELRNLAEAVEGAVRTLVSRDEIAKRVSELTCAQCDMRATHGIGQAGNARKWAAQRRVVRVKHEFADPAGEVAGESTYVLPLYCEAHARKAATARNAARERKGAADA